MGKFEDVTADLRDLAEITSSPIEDVHEDDIVTATDGDGDTLRLVYYVRDDCKGEGPFAGIGFHTPPGGVVLHPDEAEVMAEWLVNRIATAKERGLA